jgi:transposase
MPVGVPIKITAAQRRCLQRIRARGESRRDWSRVTALLMLEQGQSCQNVARVLGVCLDTVTNWKRRWNRGGVSGLKDKPGSGRPPTVTPRYLRLLRQAVDRGPQAYGYLITVWSSARLAAHLEKKTHIRIGPKQLRRHLQRLGFVYRRPKHTLKSRQNPQEVRAAEKRLLALKKGLVARAPGTNSGSRTRPTSTFTLI